MTVSLGPFPMRVVAVAAAALLAWWLVRMLARRMGGAVDAPVPKLAGALFTDAFFVGLLAARLGYVLRWWPEYAVAPWSIIAVGDGGFLWWIGLPVALAFAGWRSTGQPGLRRAAVTGIVTGMLVWFALLGTLSLWQRAAPPIPDIAASTLDGRPVMIAGRPGKPMVLNLWASWCPPCRREMPVLTEAVARYPDVQFVLLNQGEDATTVRAFLDQQHLPAHVHVLLDPSSNAMTATGARALPTTLFVAPDGRLVDSHTGELTRASLADTLGRRFGVQPTLAANAGE